MRIHFYTSEVERLLGIKVPPSQVADILRRLDFKVEVPHNADVIGQDTTMLVDVPSYRNDVTLPADLVEEVARITGYDLIPETLLNGGLPPQEVNYSLELEAESARPDGGLRYGRSDLLLGDLERGAGEAGGDGRRTKRTKKVAEHAKEATAGVPRIRYVAPTRDDREPDQQQAGRHAPHLLPNMLDTLRNNLKGQPDRPVRIFELGKVYLTPTEEEIEARREAMRQERERYPRMNAWDLWNSRTGCLSSRAG